MLSKVDGREVAMGWWNALDFQTKFFHVINFLSSKDRDTTERHPDSLTGREIQEIYEFIKK